MYRQALIALEEVVEKIEFAEELFSVSFAKRPINHVFNNKKVFFTETEMFTVYCAYDESEFKIILSVDKLTIRGDTSIIRGIAL